MAEFISIRVSSVLGSTPREVGASMRVSATDQTGTIGGGRLEFDAIAHARGLLESRTKTDHQIIHLGPNIGQCCGGAVGLDFTSNVEEGANPNSMAKSVSVFIFGGGHVGKALANAFSPLPVTAQVVETRGEYLADLPENIDTQELAAPEAAARNAPKNSVFIVVTHDHALDFLIVEEALKREDAAYVGLIGSETKRAVIKKRLEEVNISTANLVCPIGAAGLGDKRPEVIAAFVVPEVLLAIGLPS